MKDIYETFQAVASHAAQRVAIEYGSTCFTYGALAADAERLAVILRQEGVTAGAILAAGTDDRIACIVTMLAAMRTGACIMPLGSRMSQGRVQFALRDTDANFVVADPTFSAWASEASRTAVPVALECARDLVLWTRPGRRNPDRGREPRSGDANPFYVYYTSGSTGRPKGIVGQRQAISHFIDWEITTLALDAATRASQLIEPTFDAFFRDAFVPLCVGGVLCIPADSSVLGDGRRLRRWLEDQRITLMHAVPTIWRTLFASNMDAASLPCLRHVLLSGEVLRGADVQRWLDGPGERVALVNLYGPSETTMTKFFHRVQSADARRTTVPIGRPMDGAKAIVLDAARNPCGPGEVGEIYIRTPYRTLGYLNRPEPTAEAFIPNPFGSDPSDIIYRTGDFGRRLDDGTFELHGRKDGQVKIRGVRVEIAEVENALAKCPGVEGIVVDAEEEESGGHTLVAYYLTNDVANPEAVRAHARAELPDALLPSRFVALPEFPRTSSGKIDRAALRQSASVRAMTSGFVAPVGPREELLADLFARVLQRRPISASADFFAIGGHSLNAIVLVAEIEQAFGVAVTLPQIFASPTVRRLAAVLGAASPSGLPPLRHTGARPRYPVSSSQKRIFTVQQFDPESTAYNMPAAYRVTGTMTAEQLQAAVHAVIQTHDVLRTRFVADAGLEQIVDEETSFNVETRTVDALDPAEELRSFVRPFDLMKGPLVRVRWIRSAAGEGLLLLDRHHIVTDAVSNALLIAELSRALAGQALARPAYRYVDYAIWQQHCLSSGAFAAHRQYWRDQFSTPPPVLELPTDYVRPKTMTFQGADCAFEVGPDLTAALQSFCRARAVTPFMVLFAAYSALLARYSGQEDVVIGVTVAGRETAPVQDIVGLFINILPFRVQPVATREFESCLEEVKRSCVNGLSHQSYPFEELVNDLDLSRDVSRNPLFDTMFVVQNAEQRELEHAGLRLLPAGSGTRMTKFDLTFMFWELSGGISFRIEYRTSLFARGTIERMGRHLRQILANITSEPRTRLGDLELLDPREYTALVETYNRTAAAFDVQPLPRLIESQARRTPEAVALICGPDRLTYAQLDALASRVARWLVAQASTSTAKVVGVAVRPSIEMVVLALGVMKSGAAYVPMDLEWPADRMAFVRENSGAACVLSRAVDAHRFTTGAFITIEDILGSADAAAAPPPPLALGDVAYIIYTSGSTGRPKGVVIEHGAAANTLLDINTRFAVGPSDRILGVSAFTFDLSVYDLWGTLQAGAALVIPTEAEFRDPTEWLRVAREQRVTVWNSVPALVQLLVDAAAQPGARTAETLRLVMMSGDWIPVSLPGQIRASFGHAAVVSLGGATEASIWSIIYQIGEVDPAWRSIPYGYPLCNQSYYVLDPQLRVCPTSVPGELYIGGAGVARQYCNAPELTPRSFIDHPEFGRLYRTGDIGRHSAEGYIVFMGRKDAQVKVNGYRIELEEIEATALKLDGVDRAVATVQAPHGEPQLALFYTSDRNVETAALRAFLGRMLPRYMVPRHMARLDRIPLSANGKVDRGALPACHEAPEFGAPTARSEPADPVEQIFLRVWRDILGRETLGVDDDFFLAGGDSIKAIQIASTLGRHNYRVRIPDILEHATVRQLVATAGPRRPSQRARASEASVPLSPVQHWFLSQRFAAPQHWNQSIFLWRSGGVEVAALQEAWRAVMERHELLRARLRGGNLELAHATALAIQVQIFELPDGQPAMTAVRPITDRLQASFKLEEGPLIQCALFREERGDHLLLLAHHLVMDGLSWRILITDLAVAYELARTGRSAQLPPTPIAFGQWTDALRRFADDPRLRQERPYWQEVGAHFRARWTGQVRGCADQARVTNRVVGADKLHRYLDTMRRAFRANMNECLLSALGLALADVFDDNEHVVNLEGHGRSSAIEDLDVSETIGWFTNLFPVVLVAQPDRLADHVRATQERLQAIPNDGLGYGIGRYLSRDADWPAIDPEISFNYLGEFDRELAQAGFEISPFSGGKRMADENQPVFAVNIVSVMRHGELALTVTCDTARVPEDLGPRMLKRIEDAIDRLTESCRRAEPSSPEPGDFSMPGLTRSELADILETCARFGCGGQLEHIFPLSPMQQGLLFHLMERPGDVAYMVQIRIDISGALDRERFIAAFTELQARHEMLRTRVLQGPCRPLLVTLRAGPARVEWNEAPTHDLDAKAAEHLEGDRRQGFGIGLDQPLVRAAVLKGPGETWSVVFSFHHLVVDGWCIGVVLKEFLAIYSMSLGKAAVGGLSTVPPYRAYAQWLTSRDEAQSIGYWRRYLSECEEPTTIFGGEGTGAAEYKLVTRAESLSESITAALETASRARQLTLNSLMQTLWALLLGDRSRNDDVVYGVVVSGRNAEAAGIETMVGSFICTVPLRVPIRDGDSLWERARIVQREFSESNEHSYVGLAEIQKAARSPRRLIDHIYHFQNHPKQDRLAGLAQAAGLGWRIDRLLIHERNGYDFNLLLFPGPRLLIEFNYNARRHRTTFIEELLADYAGLAAQVAGHSDVTIRDLRTWLQARTAARRATASTELNRGRQASLAKLRSKKSVPL